MKPPNHKKDILAYAFAYKAFTTAELALSVAMAADEDKDQEAYIMAFFALSTAYARPFLASNGVRNLKAEFCDFSSSQHKAHLERAHHDLMECRKRIYGHTDFERAEIWESENKDQNPPLDEIMVTFEGDTFLIATREPMITPDFLPAISELIEFQKLRAHFGIYTRLKYIAGGIFPREGEFIITPDGFQAV
jgi:hypothetical protein